MWYCDKECQKQDWKLGHRFKECDLLKCDSIINFECDQEFKPRILIRFALRAKLDPIANKLWFKLYDNRIRKLENVMSHTDELRKSQGHELEFVRNLFQAIKKSSINEFTEDFLIEKYSQIFTNAFAIIDEKSETNEEVACGLYISASCFDHSCRPTASRVFDGTKLQVRALASMDTDHEQPTICYIDTIQDRDSRRAILRTAWCFECECPKCSKHTDANFDYVKYKEVDARAMESTDLTYIRSAVILTRELFGDYHPRITAHMNNLFCAEIANMPDAPLTSDTIKKWADRVKTIERQFEMSINVTHGRSSPLYKMFLDFKQMAYNQLLQTKAIDLFK